MKDTLEAMVKASCSRHAQLIEMGVPAIQALRIAFGAKFANAAIEVVEKLNMEKRQNPQGGDNSFIQSCGII